MSGGGEIKESSEGGGLGGRRVMLDPTDGRSRRPCRQWKPQKEMTKRPNVGNKGLKITEEERNK